MKNARFSGAQIMPILRQAGNGVPVPELCREHGMSSGSFYKWRAKFEVMDASMVSEMKAMAEEKGSKFCHEGGRSNALSHGSDAAADWQKIEREPLKAPKPGSSLRTSDAQPDCSQSLKTIRSFRIGL